MRRNMDNGPATGANDFCRLLNKLMRIGICGNACINWWFLIYSSDCPVGRASRFDPTSPFIFLVCKRFVKLFTSYKILTHADAWYCNLLCSTSHLLNWSINNDLYICTLKKLNMIYLGLCKDSIRCFVFFY